MIEYFDRRHHIGGEGKVFLVAYWLKVARLASYGSTMRWAMLTNFSPDTKREIWRLLDEPTKERLRAISGQ